MQELVCLAFSADDKFIMSVSGAPDWKVGIWSIDKAKLIAECQVSSSSKFEFFK